MATSDIDGEPSWSLNLDLASVSFEKSVSSIKCKDTSMTSHQEDAPQCVSFNKLSYEAQVLK